LRVPEDAVGKRIRCPKCTHQFPFALPQEAEEAEEAVVATRRAPAGRRAVADEPPPDDDEEPEMLEEVSEEEVPEAERSPMDQPRKKKKKKKRRRQLLAEQEREEREDSSWPWWVFGGGGMAIAELVFLTLAIFGSTLVRLYGIYMFISVPIGVVIFFAAMVLASVTFGAVEIGRIHVTFVKSFIAVTIANTIFALPIPFGVWAGLAIWCIIIMSIFRLEYWEAMIIAAFNWVLNFGVKFIIFMIIMAIAAKAAGRLDDDKPRNNRNNNPPAQNQRMPDDDDDDRP
jgi:hypothetical protein